MEPPNPSYARNEGIAVLTWDYDGQSELQGILHSVQDSSGAFTGMLVQLNDGTVMENSRIPAAYKERVLILGNAYLVIKNITHQDNTRFRCTLLAKHGAGLDIVSEVQLIVTGMYNVENNSTCLNVTYSQERKFHCTF